MKFESTNLQKCSGVPENSLHQCQNGCFQVCSDCLLENSKCQECLEYCIITPKVAKDVLEIIQKHEYIPQGSIISYMVNVYRSIGENGKSVLFILSLIMAIMIAKYSQSWQNVVRISLYLWSTSLDRCLFSIILSFFRSSKIPTQY